MTQNLTQERREMKKLISCFALLALTAQTGLADEVTTESQAERSPSTVAKDQLENRVLNLGSQEELTEMARVANPKLIESIKGLDIELTSEQEKKLTELALSHKSDLIIAAVTGEIPEELYKEASKIVPKLNELKQEQKQELLKETTTTINKIVFDKMIEATGTLGAISGDQYDSAVAQINARLKMFRDIRIGDITIKDIKSEITIGYPRGELLLLSGDIQKDGSDKKFHARLLGLSRDSLTKTTDFNIGTGSMRFKLNQYLDLETGVGVGFRTFDALYVDPFATLHAEQMIGPVKLKEYAKLQIQVNTLRAPNLKASCGVSADYQIVENDFINLGARLITEIEGNTNPTPYQNSGQWFSGLAISGEF